MIFWHLQAPAGLEVGLGDSLGSGCMFESQELLGRKDPSVVPGRDSWQPWVPRPGTSSLSLSRGQA